MKNILARQHRVVLAQFAWSNVLLGFDFDGTLSPIVGDPENAALRPRTRESLEALAKLYPTVVISGRALSDVRQRLRGLGIRSVIGNHGLEPWHAPIRFTRDVKRWRSVLEPRLRAFKGIVIEDKGFSLALHYRQSREKRKARAAILAAASELTGVRVVGGKLVINLLPSDAPHKGMALERERVRLGCDTAIYVGDDETDEDVFALDQPGRLLSIRVGRKSASFAPYCIAGQAAMDELLKALLELRRKGDKARQTARKTPHKGARSSGAR